MAHITNAFHSLWMQILQNYTENINSLVIQDHSLIKNIKYFPGIK